VDTRKFQILAVSVVPENFENRALRTAPCAKSQARRTKNNSVQARSGSSSISRSGSLLYSGSPNPPPNATLAISFVVIRSPAHAAVFAAGRSCRPQPQRSVEMPAWTSLALLHVTRPDPMFGRYIHTMLRGLRLDRYAFPLSAVRCPSRRRSR
jgi:hypothetical protein